MVDIHGKPECGVGSGVIREVYSSFWVEVKDCYFIGEQERVPIVRHDLLKEEWVAISTILVKGFTKTANISQLC